MSTMRSRKAVASGRPAPRYAAVGVVFVAAADRVQLDLGDRVHALGHRAGQERQEGADRRVAAGVADHFHPQGDHRAVASEPELDQLDLAAAVRHREQVLGAGLGPLHRAVQALGERGGDDELAVEPGLRAEPAPDRGRQDVDLVRVQADRGGERVAHAERALGRHGDVEPPVGRGLDEDPVRLHRDRGDPLVHEPALHDDLGVVEDLGVLPEVELDGQVRAVLREQQRRVVGERGFGVDHDGQRVVVDDDQLGGVDRLRAWCRPRRPRRCRRRTARPRPPAAGG